MSVFKNSSNTQFRGKERHFVDNAIRANTVLVIDGESGDNLGSMALTAALATAKARGLNLIQISSGGAGVPTCKILDYGKFKYDESKKFKAQQKKQREAQIEDKEIIFRPDTAQNDLRIKAKKVLEFLSEGARVRITVKCKGREITHQHVVRQQVDFFMSLILPDYPEITAIPTASEQHGKFCYLLIIRENHKK